MLLRADGEHEVRVPDVTTVFETQVADELWLATDLGAWRVEAGKAVQLGPRHPLHVVQAVANERWLLGEDFVVRLVDENELILAVEGARPHRIVAINNERWVLTKEVAADAAFDLYAQLTAEAGPLLHLEGDYLKPVPLKGRHAKDVVELDGAYWCCTGKDGRDGPLVKVSR